MLPSIPKSTIKRDGYILFQVKKTQVEMMEDRGLIIPDFERELFLSYEPFKESIRIWEERQIRTFVEHYGKIAQEKEVNFNTTLTQVYENPKTSEKTIAIYLFRERDSNTITSNEFQAKFHKYQERYSTKGLPLHMVFISEVPVNSKAISKLKLIKTQFFLTKNLNGNPTRNIFYYPHEKLNEEERKKLADTGFEMNKLPIIHKSDPISQYFDWQDGDVILIRRTERFLEMPAPDGLYWRIVRDK